jgi:1-acyl-sn-glycerol-3-phosphate acyltransferase
MIKARHHWLYEFLIGSYVRMRMKISFRKVRIHSEIKNKNIPVLLLGNHSSWWDGFFARKVNKQIFRRRFHVMVMEKELRKVIFLSRMGAFSINKQSRSMVNTLDYTAEILSHPENLVTIFPQGQLQSVHQRPLKFEKGWFSVLKKARNPVQVIFMVCLSDYGSKPRPVINIYLEEYMPGKEFSAPHIEQLYNDFLERCVLLQNENL